MLDLDLGEGGAFVGDKVVGVTHFQQPLGTVLKGVGGVSPLDWVDYICKAVHRNTTHAKCRRLRLR